MRVNKHENIYDKLRKMYYEKTGMDFREYQGMYSIFVLTLVFGLLLLIYSSIVSAPFYFAYSYFVLIFTLCVLAFSTYMDSKNEKITGEEKIRAIEKAISAIIPDFSEDSCEVKLVVIRYFEDQYRESFRYRCWSGVGRTMCFIATVIIEVFCAYTWYLAGSLKSMPVILLAFLILLQIVVHVFGSESMYEPCKDRCISYSSCGYKKHIIEAMVSDEFRSVL